MKIGSVTVGMVQTNCYFITNEKTSETIIIDPGAEADQLLDELRQKELKLVGILLTHGHFDHIMAVNELRQATMVKAYACEQEQALLEDARLNCSGEIGRPYEVIADVFVKDGQVLELGGMKVSVIGTPGHTAGGVCYLIEDEQGEQALFCGDSLFFESVGRTDLPTGNGRVLMESIQKLFALDGALTAYPGHGPKTSIGYEKVNNPFA